MSEFESLKVAWAVRAAADEASVCAVARAFEFRLKAEKARRSLAELEERAAARDAEAMAAGGPLPEAPHAEGRMRMQHAREAQAAEAAARKADDERTGLAERHREAESLVVDRALAACGSLRDAARANVLAGLDSLAPHLGAMIAAHRLRDRLCSETFTFDTVCISPADLYDGATVARKFTATLPARLRPADFSARVEAAAETVLADLLADLGSPW